MVAQGYIINRDKTLTPCYIVRYGNSFAHGESLKDAARDALAKHMQDMPEEERIAEFIKAHPDVSATYPCEDLFRWHNTLTGSCEFGRRQFCKDNGIDLNGSYTVLFFLNITKNAYGGEVIKSVIREYGVVSNTADGYALDEVDLYCDESDNLVVGVSEDYWEKLKHQAAINIYCSYVADNGAEWSANQAIEEATALVEKLKE